MTDYASKEAHKQFGESCNRLCGFFVSIIDYVCSHNCACECIFYV